MQPNLPSLVAPSDIQILRYRTMIPYDSIKLRFRRTPTQDLLSHVAKDLPVRKR